VEKVREEVMERAREKVVEKVREKVTKEKVMEREMEKVKGEVMERAMKRRVAIVFGASQPTLALGRQTSNCHAGQDWCGRFYFRLFLAAFFGEGRVLVSIFRKAAL
jgi:hypothetical protein